MIAEKSNLVKVFQSVKPGLAKRDIIEQFTHFIFTGSEVMTYNDEICISHPLKTDFQCSVSAEELYKTLMSIQGEATVTMEKKEDELSIRTSKTEAGISIMAGGQAEEMIQLLNLRSLEGKWEELPKDFLEGMSLCMFSASTDMTSGIATCVRIKGDSLVSSDESRISKYTLNKETSMDTLIPARNIKELTNYENLKYFHISDRWAHFKTEDGVTFSSRTMEGEYPEVEKYLEVEGIDVEMPMDLKTNIDSITFMTDGKHDIDKQVKIEVSKNQIRVRAKKDIGWINKIIDVEKLDKGSFNFDINPIFLSQILEKATVMVIGENVAKFSRKGFNHVIALPS